MKLTHTLGLILLAGLLFACNQKPREQWPVIIMADCTTAEAEHMERMKVRCQPAHELEPRVYADWHLRRCQQLPDKLDVSKEQAKEWWATCEKIYERQIQNIEAIEEGRPMPYPPQTKEEFQRRLFDFCNKMNEAWIKQGRDAKELAHCEDILRPQLKGE